MRSYPEYNTIPRCHCVLPTTHISPAAAAEAIRVLRAVDARLLAHYGEDGGTLRICLNFAKDAVWAAAYPGDSLGMLDLVATQAENALG